MNFILKLFSQFDLDLSHTVLGFEQALVIVLLCGRAFLPRGKMTRLQLSDMLSNYIGMAIDILEFLQLGLGVGGVVCSETESLAVACLVIVSLVPLTYDLNLFFSGSRRKDRNEHDQKPCKWWYRCSSEVKIIVMLMICQDFTFLCYRIYLINKFPHDLDDFQALVFFMIKNILVLMIQVYRLIIIRWNSKEDNFEKDREDKKQGDQKDTEMS